VSSQAGDATGFETEPIKNPGDLFGHPKGLYVLFFTELWERFSFYGMKTLLVLYMINHFFWSQEDASHLLGTYAALAYGLPVVGGFIADRWLGAKRSVIVGAVLLSIGHFLMAFEPLPFFYTALGFIIAGVGLLKPNVSTQVGSLYKPDDPRRDGAFTIFYMGINLGALIGPLLCDWLRVTYGWHYGFGAAGVGMVFGLIVYIIGQRKLVEFSQETADAKSAESHAAAEAHPAHVVRDRIAVLLVIFVFIILFWTAFEQSPNSMLVWADKHTNLQLASSTPPPVSLDDLAETAEEAAAAAQISIVGAIGEWFRNPSVTSGQTQSFNPFFIITLAPIFAFFWIWLDKRKLQPSTPAKMAIGLFLVAVAFGFMWPAAYHENRPSTADISEIPEGIHVDEQGKVFWIETEDDGSTENRYFGATRLRFVDQKMHMSGVLTDLDRLRLLAETAPAEFVEALEALSEEIDQKRASDAGDEEWEISKTLPSAPSDYRLQGEQARKVASWNMDTQTLTATGEIKARARIEILAGAADPMFKQAVDKIYLDSARFRVSVWWLIAFFMILTMGELCLSPVGLSLVTKLAPPKHVGLCMGGWFLATAVAEYTAQIFGAWWGKMAPVDFFMIFVIMCGIGAVLLAVLIKPLKRMMHGVH